MHFRDHRKIIERKGMLKVTETMAFLFYFGDYT